MTNQDNQTETMEKLEVLWTVPMVAAYFSLTEGTVYNWISEGKIRTVKVGTKSVRIPKSEIERIVRESKSKLKKQS